MARNVRRERCSRCGRIIGVYRPSTGHARFGTGVFRSHSPSGRGDDVEVCSGSGGLAPVGGR
jgi:hypothetical protein